MILTKEVKEQLKQQGNYSYITEVLFFLPFSCQPFYFLVIYKALLLE